MTTVKRLIKSNPVLIIAAVLALFTCFLVKPDSHYIEYFDFKTLACLFCTLAVVCALKNIRFFTILARSIIHATGNLHNDRVRTIRACPQMFQKSVHAAYHPQKARFLPAWDTLQG